VLGRFGRVRILYEDAVLMQQSKEVPSHDSPNLTCPVRGVQSTHSSTPAFMTSSTSSALSIGAKTFISYLKTKSFKSCFSI